MNLEIGGYGDRRRTTLRYLEALKLLQKVTEGQQIHGKWGAFELPELIGEPERFDDAEFRKKIDKVLDSMRPHCRDRSLLGKCKTIIESIFTASSAFAKNFLNIAQQAASVSLLRFTLN